jgi:hypothetical protein
MTRPKTAMVVMALAAGSASVGPPAVTIAQPAPATYLHTDTVTLSYSAADGETGVQSIAAFLDNSSTLHGLPLTNGRTIDFLTELLPGRHTLLVQASDKARPRANTGRASVTFDIVVTARSLIDDVNRFLGTGQIRSSDEGNSLLKKLAAAAIARANGQGSAAANLYQAFIAEVQAQTGRTVSAAAAAILIADAQYVIAHCP